MKQISSRIYPQRINITASIGHLRLVLLLLSGLILVSIGVRAFAQTALSNQSPSNPFLDYADIFPGQATAALKLRAFSCYKIYNYQLTANISCNLEFSSGIFTRIESKTWDGLIHQTTFTLRDNTLKVGNIILLFGRPNFRAYSRQVFYFWNKLFVIATTSAAGNPVTMRPVWSLTFADTY